MEWRAFLEREGRYCPHLDIAVGPFSTVPGKRRIDEYEELASRHKPFLTRLWACHVDNEHRLGFDDDKGASLEQALASNRNARCFLAVEIENAVSRKHLMGGIVNAAALGHLAILVGWTDEKVKAAFRARKYLQFLSRVDKPSMAVGNLLILGRQQARGLFDGA